MIGMLDRENYNSCYIKGGCTPDLENLAISIFNEKMNFIFSKLLEKTQYTALKSNISTGTFHRICGGVGFNKKQSKRLLIFFVKAGKIKNRGKAGLEIIS